MSESRTVDTTAAIEAVRQLHRPVKTWIEEYACYHGECDNPEHEDGCPEVEVEVCRECDGIREGAHEEAGVILWPCATIKALNGEGTDG